MPRGYFNKLAQPGEETRIAPAVLIATALIAFSLLGGIVYQAILFIL